MKVHKDWTVVHLTDPSVNVPFISLSSALQYIVEKLGRVVYLDHLRREVMMSDYPRHNSTAHTPAIPPIPRELLVR